jgi:hypothetical protein
VIGDDFLKGEGCASLQPQAIVEYPGEVHGALRSRRSLVRAINTKIVSENGVKARAKSLKGHAETPKAAAKATMKIKESEMKSCRYRDGNPVWLRLFGAIGRVLVIICHFSENRNYM